MDKRRYKAHIQSVAPKQLKKDAVVNNDKCILGISMGNPNMEKAKLEASIQWVS
ncbi:MAG: hypothetical protein GY710_01415, partial [Desulfobacteraceae bacterium]|nr:hypothetical protein [Desulfobacteraceae bacterium]MCP3940128.1 hypothetical protein [Desulfobacteraceae bacterium]